MKKPSPRSHRLGLALAISFITLIPKAYPFAVAMPTQWSTEAAIEMLERGGNAVDAMVAGSFVLNVTQPYNMGLGGGGFFLLENKGRVVFLDSREQAPASASASMFLGKDGKPIEYYPDRVTGPNPVGVPGTLAGLWQAHRRYGRLSWKTVLEPAIRRAREGFPITQRFAEVLASEWPRISRFAATVAIFSDGEGAPLKQGRLLRQPVLARTLERIAREGAPAFYHGALAHQWISEAQRLGVQITFEDLNRFRVREADPIEFNVFNLHAKIAPPPSGGGLVVAATLRFLEDYYKTHDVPAPDSPQRVIATTEALRYFQRLRDDAIADPPYSKLDPQKFLGSADEKTAWKEINRRIAARRDRIETRVTRYHVNPAALPLAEIDRPSSHTAHSSVIDDNGMAVAYTSTIEQWFGSGLAVPGFGFLLNNELSDFSPDPASVNAPAPGKRPRSNMSPLFLFDGSALVGALGCAGGPRIPTVIVELLENYYIFKMSLREAIAFPRFHPSGDDQLDVDTNFPAKLLPRLKEAGYAAESVAVGGVPQALLRRDPRATLWEAAAEPRADGLAITLPIRKARGQPAASPAPARSE